MKKYIFICTFLAASVCCCKSNDSTKTQESNIQLPFTASYTTNFTDNVSDSDLLAVLNTYKSFENLDPKAFRSYLADTVTAHSPDGMTFHGSADSLSKIMQKEMDSLSSVKITMITWLKNHAVKDTTNFINVWYKETDTYKSGKVDSAEYEDDNIVKKGKVVWHNGHMQMLRP